jgi:predicted DCC family thiol-disulfide oxidoreductase YuxK
MTKRDHNTAIILFDGVCNLCNYSVNFIISRDRRAYFRFASLQSPVGQELLQQYELSNATLDSVILLDNGRMYQRSTAALRITRRLRQPWPLCYAFIIIPKFIRDLIYNFIARNRYRWFGQRDLCRVPTPEERSRFL